MMGREEAEQFLSTRLSNAKIYQQNKGGVRYLSNVPESLKALKSLNTFKEKGRWELMPKDTQPQNDYYESEDEGEEQYLEYDDVYEEILENPKANKLDKLVKRKSDGSPSSSGGGQGFQGGILLSNHNRFYKKET
jgi:hypothetical protein